jgi:hypothetical protein
VFHTTLGAFFVPWCPGGRKNSHEASKAQSITSHAANASSGNPLLKINDPESEFLEKRNNFEF